MAKVCGPIDKQFKAKLQKSPAKEGWTYVVMPNSATFFGTRGLIRVRVAQLTALLASDAIRAKPMLLGTRSGGNPNSLRS
jgi:Domain of unknown function (DUF1905)